MSDIKELIKNNREWVEEINKTNPELFESLSSGQKPDYLWIGCSDSRVPASQVCGLIPGDMFVHRNIANVVSINDISCLSVLQFAIEVLKVKKIILCGHYSCGGVETVVRKKSFGLIDNWLTSVHEVEEKHREFIDKTLAHIADDEARVKKKVDMMCELNSLHQALNLCKTTVVKNAWQNGLDFTVHSAIYSVADGKLHQLGEGVNSREQMDKVYNQALEQISAKYCKK